MSYFVAPQPEQVYPVVTVSSHAAFVITVSSYAAESFFFSDDSGIRCTISQ